MARSPTYKQVERSPRRAPAKRSKAETEVIVPSVEHIPKSKRSNEPIKPLNEAQKRYLTAMSTKILTFASGPAGTGKTWLAAALAAKALDEGGVDSIVITRPAIEAGESLGFLPGEIDDKFDPYLAPFRIALEERLGKTFVGYLIKTGRIKAAPLAYMRGHTFNDSFVILDEGQNTTPTQMKMFLTRIGKECTVVVNGDIAQKDIRGISGLEDAIRRCSWIPDVAHIEFTRDDIVRSGIVQDIVASYDSEENERI